MGLESTSGQTASHSKVSGTEIGCMEKVFLCGRTVSTMTDSSPTTNEKDKEYSGGRTVGCMRASGEMASNTESGSFKAKTASQGRENGKTGKRWHG